MESSKENLAPQGIPLMRGQRAPVHCAEAEKLRGHREWEARLRSDPDPLNAWERYVQWVRETSDCEEYKQVLHRCVQHLSPELFRTDYRYLRLWMRYAGCLAMKDQRIALEHMEANRIGEDQALLYIAYGTYLEKIHDFDAARMMYEKGIERRAEPLDKLQENYVKFQGRMVNRRRKAAARLHLQQERSAKRKQITPFKASRGGHSSIASSGERKSWHEASTASGSEPTVARGRGGREEVRGYDSALLMSRDGKAANFEEQRAQHWQINRHEMRSDLQMTVQGSSAYALGTGPWKKGGWTPTAELAGRTTGRSQPNQAQTPLPHRLAPDDPAERMGLSRQRSTTLAASGVTAPIPDVTPVPGDCGISASQSWQREDPASLLSVRSLQLLDVSPFNPAGPPPATCQSEATPSVTFSTRRALYEINNMFQNAPSCEGGGNADPTVTFATRAAMGAIDEMFREEISSSAERSPPTFQVTKDLSFSAECLHEGSTTGGMRPTPQAFHDKEVQALRVGARDTGNIKDHPSQGEPTMTLATREAMGVIDQMFREELPCSMSNPPDAFRNDQDLSFKAAERQGNASDMDGSQSVRHPFRSEGREDETGIQKYAPNQLPSQTIDPFSLELRRSLLGTLSPPLDQWSDVFCGDGETDSVLSALQSTGCEGEFLELNDQPFCVRRILGSGAYARCFEVDMLGEDTGDDSETLMALKVEAPPCPWEFYIGRVLHGRMASMVGADRFLQMRRLHLETEASFLFTSLGTHGTLHDLVNLYRIKGQAGLPESIARFYAMDILAMMRDLHGCSIIHADIKPDNLLIRQSGSWASWDVSSPGTWLEAGLQLIDFGRAIDLELLPDGVQFLADCGPECFRCIEMQEGRPWTYQVDCYGVASVLYFMLFGEYIKVQRVTDPALSQTTYRLKTPLKRYWACDLWEDLFCTLLNQSGCSKPPPWDSLHAKFQDHWATNPTTAKTLLTDLRKQVIYLHKD